MCACRLFGRSFAVAIRFHFAAPIEQRLVQNALRFRFLQVHLVLGTDAQFFVLELLELFADKVQTEYRILVKRLHNATGFNLHIIDFHLTQIALLLGRSIVLFAQFANRTAAHRQHFGSADRFAQRHERIVLRINGHKATVGRTL